VIYQLARIWAKPAFEAAATRGTIEAAFRGSVIQRFTSKEFSMHRCLALDQKHRRLFRIATLRSF